MDQTVDPQEKTISLQRNRAPFLNDALDGAGWCQHSFSRLCAARQR